MNNQEQPNAANDAPPEILMAPADNPHATEEGRSAQGQPPASTESGPAGGDAGPKIKWIMVPQLRDSSGRLMRVRGRHLPLSKGRAARITLSKEQHDRKFYVVQTLRDMDFAERRLMALMEQLEDETNLTRRAFAMSKLAEQLIAIKEKRGKLLGIGPGGKLSTLSKRVTVDINPIPISRDDNRFEAPPATPPVTPPAGEPPGQAGPWIENPTA